MSPHRRYAAAALALAAVLAASAASAARVVGPIRVNRCDPRASQVVPGGYVPGFYPGRPYFWRDVYGFRYLQPRYTVTSASLAIDYENVTPKPLHEIEFGLIARGHLVAEVRDVGTFTQGAEIKHEFGLDSNVFPLGTGLPVCLPLRATYADGTVWRNPHLPAIRRSIYAPE